MSRTWSETNKILSDIRMACKSNRERKDDGVKELEDHTAPTPVIFERLQYLMPLTRRIMEVLHLKRRPRVIIEVLPVQSL